MDALILGGNSPHNKEWVQQLRAALTPLFATVATHDYAHWASGGSTIEFDHELRAIQQELRPLQDFVVVAKSAGVLLTLKGMADNTVRPEKVIFMGLPLGYIRQHNLEHEFESWLKSLTEPILVIQNAHDPVGSAAEVDRYLRTILSPSLITFVELPGDTHDYIDLPKITTLTKDFIS
ncbi:MAG TPA: hypothetical protein VFB59_01765 [Candidatus Saccharimonadales bacterium]|nr:hypothetical protein [Candidatus Saccharimonadales bacterium]